MAVAPLHQVEVEMVAVENIVAGAEHRGEVGPVGGAMPGDLGVVVPDGDDAVEGYPEADVLGGRVPPPGGGGGVPAPPSMSGAPGASGIRAPSGGPRGR